MATPVRTRAQSIVANSAHTTMQNPKDSHSLTPAPRLCVLWLTCVAGVLREVTAPPRRRVLVRHFNAVVQNS